MPRKKKCKEKGCNKVLSEACRKRMIPRCLKCHWERERQKKIKAIERKKNTKKYQKTQLKKAEDRGDRLWSKVTKKHYGRKCAYGIGCKGNIESHHVINRSHKILRFDIRNCVVLCSKHHKFCEKFSAHQTPLEFSVWFKAHRGQEEVDYLLQKRNEHLNYNIEFIESEIIKLKQYE